MNKVPALQVQLASAMSCQFMFSSHSKSNDSIDTSFTAYLERASPARLALLAHSLFSSPGGAAPLESLSESWLRVGGHFRRIVKAQNNFFHLRSNFATHGLYLCSTFCVLRSSFL